MKNFTFSGFKTRLKKQVPNWDDDLVTIAKLRHHKAKMTFIVNGKLKSVEEWYNDQYFIDHLAPKFIEYFNTGVWDDAEYYIKTSGFDDKDMSRVFITYNQKDVNKLLGFLRETEGDKGCGITNVPKDSFDVTPIKL